MTQLNDKVAGLNHLTIEPLIRELTSFTPKSISSKTLKATLETIAINTAFVSNEANEGKKWLLQINQLRSKEHPEPLKHFTKEFISGLELDAAHQNELTIFMENNTARDDSQKLRMQKTAIQEFLAAEKNSGKQMQNIIYHHFFQGQIGASQVDSRQNGSETSLLL